MAGLAAVLLAAAPAFAAGSNASTPAAGSVARADLRLEPGAPVFGIVVGDEPRAYALADLQSAGVVVHDVVSGGPIDVGFEADEVGVREVAGELREHRQTSWGEWITSHPDSSLWRVPAIAEPADRRPAADIRVTESRHYRTAFGCAMSADHVSGGHAPPGLFVISGEIANVTRDPVHHVVLRYELVDGNGKVVYRDEGFNRSAEALAAPRLADAGAVVPIDGGKTDTFRMIFLAGELPAFEQTRVTVSRVY